LKIEGFFEASLFASSRRGGRMMEWWNIVFKRKYSLINSLSIPLTAGSINHYSNFPGPIIPWPRPSSQSAGFKK
jgi:hypothetical protein